MPEHVFTVVARGHAVDVQTNSLTLFSVLEDIGVASLPVAIPGFSVVTLWKREPDDEGVSFVQQMRLMDPDGIEVLHGEQEFRMVKMRHRALGIVEFAPFARTGCYKVEILLRRADQQPSAFALKASYPLDVSIAAPAEQGLFTPAKEP